MLANTSHIDAAEAHLRIRYKDSWQTYSKLQSLPHELMMMQTPVWMSAGHYTSTVHIAGSTAVLSSKEVIKLQPGLCHRPPFYLRALCRGVCLGAVTIMQREGYLHEETHAADDTTSFGLCGLHQVSKPAVNATCTHLISQSI
jgi:hypothetical protein